MLNEEINNTETQLVSLQNVESEALKVYTGAKYDREQKQAELESLYEEKKGLFGMPGAKPAKVRVTVIKAKENA